MTDGRPPIRFCFGLHLHQPVGNFGYVFEQHVRDVYMPFLDLIEKRGFFPVALHVSGPLIEWLETHDARYLDRLARLTSDGQVELLLAGFYEPVLASLPRQDRIEQIGWMREKLQSRFGVTAEGLWLTERVWEPDLAADLHDAGVRYALVDDRHFLVSGFSRDRLHAHLLCEHAGKRLALFPIDERLRYLVPFQPPAQTVDYLRELRGRGQGLAVLADDGEKFGGWPGTKEWVFDRGWLAQFIDAMEGAVRDGDVKLSTFGEALRETPSAGLAYLATASYREMEAWALPTESAVRLAALERDLGAERMAGPDGALVRGAHWRNFQVKYAESNRMHKKMLALSLLCRERGDPTGARRAIGRAQCNDAYWHGVFGGLYLPFLRAAIWHQLAIAERELRRGESLVCEEVDIDCDGHAELWIHSDQFSAIVAPWRGGAVEELTRFGAGFGALENLADAITRRREAYHTLADQPTPDDRRPPVDGGDADDQRPRELAADATAWMGTAEMEIPVIGAEGRLSEPRATSYERSRPSPASAPSIRDIEHVRVSDELPAIDLDDRAIFVERALGRELTDRDYARARYVPARSFARTPMTWSLEHGDDTVTVILRSPDDGMTKRLTFFRDGQVRATFSWRPDLAAGAAWFATELSLAREARVAVPGKEGMGDEEGGGGERGVMWSYPIETVAKSERGLDRTKQGVAYVVRWPMSSGEGTVEIL